MILCVCYDAQPMGGAFGGFWYGFLIAYENRKCWVIKGGRAKALLSLISKTMLAHFGYLVSDGRFQKIRKDRTGHSGAAQLGMGAWWLASMWACGKNIAYFSQWSTQQSLRMQRSTQHFFAVVNAALFSHRSTQQSLHIQRSTQHIFSHRSTQHFSQHSTLAFFRSGHGNNLSVYSGQRNNLWAYIGQLSIFVCCSYIMFFPTVTTVICTHLTVVVAHFFAEVNAPLRNIFCSDPHSPLFAAVNTAFFRSGQRNHFCSDPHSTLFATVHGALFCGGRHSTFSLCPVGQFRRLFRTSLYLWQGDSWCLDYVYK
jgi:hypothetical protein